MCPVYLGPDRAYEISHILDPSAFEVTKFHCTLD